MAAAVDSRKRCVAAFLDEPSPAPLHLAKRGRFVPCAASMVPLPALAPFDPLDALRLVFPDADPQGLEACFAASGRDINAAVHAYRAQQARDALAHQLASAAADGDDERCAGVLVEQMGEATDVDDAKNRAAWMLELIRNATAERAAHQTAAEAARLREENAALREHAEHGAREAAGLREENAALREHAEHGARETARLCEENAALRERAAAAERDGTVLKRGVMAQQRRYEEMERDAAAMKKKVAELEMANYALNVRLRDADGCRFQTAYCGSDVF